MKQQHHRTSQKTPKASRVNLRRELPVMAVRATEVPRMYPISRATLYKYLFHDDPAKRLPSTKLGGARIIRVAHIEALLDSLAESEA